MTRHVERFFLGGRSTNALSGVLCGLLSLPACSQRTTDSSADDSTGGDAPTYPDLPPEADLGADAVVCGEPDDSFGMDEEVVGLTGCHIFLGSLHLTAQVTDFSPLASLRVIGGQLGTGAFNRGLETLEGLQRLESVGALMFSNDGIRDLSGIRNLREVEGDLNLSWLENLDRLDGLERLQTTGRVIIQDNALVDLDGLSGLESVDGDLHILFNEELTSVEGLAKLKRVSGDLWIQGNPKVPKAQIDALIERIEIGGTVRMDW
jgi:hypothetical protein